MMRINLPGTTSFCWRPSQGSASALPLKLFPSFSPFPSSPFITDTLVFVPCHPVDGELGSSGCISPIIRAAAFSSLTPFPLSLFALPPSLSVHLLKFPLFQDLFFLPFFFFSTPPCPLTTSTLLRFLSPSLLLLPLLPLHVPGYGLNMTAIPLKCGGIIIIIGAHQQQAVPWTNLTNTERERQRRPPQPRGSYVSI